MWGAEVSINRHGFRDDDCAVEKLPRVFRVACLGDSTTFGNGLEASETGPEQLPQGFDAIPVRASLEAAGFESVRENVVHPNAAGHRLIARAVESHVCKAVRTS